MEESHKPLNFFILFCFILFFHFYFFSSDQPSKEVQLELLLKL